MKLGKIEIFRLLQIAAFSVFAGRAWQHLFFDGPYREVFWDPNYMQGIIESLTHMTWHEYVTNPKGDIWFQRFVTAQGFVYLLFSLIVLFIKKLPDRARWFLLIGAVDLLLLAFIYMKDHFYHLGQFFEYSLQIGAPVFLFYYLKHGLTPRLVFWMKLAVALTFTCHGLYAISYYPRPVSFMTMTQNILPISGVGVAYFLTSAAILDFVVAIGIFMPKRLLKWVLVYAVFWGFLTSMARIFGNFYWDYPWESLNQWVFEAVYRFPHFLIPLTLLLNLTIPDTSQSTTCPK